MASAASAHCSVASLLVETAALKAVAGVTSTDATYRSPGLAPLLQRCSYRPWPLRASRELGGPREVTVGNNSEGETERGGRWAILLDDSDPPVFWSERREALALLCERLQERCPRARVAWQETRREVDAYVSRKKGDNDER